MNTDEIRLKALHLAIETARISSHVKVSGSGDIIADAVKFEAFILFGQKADTALSKS